MLLTITVVCSMHMPNPLTLTSFLITPVYIYMPNVFFILCTMVKLGFRAVFLELSAQKAKLSLCLHVVFFLIKNYGL